MEPGFGYVVLTDVGVFEQNLCKCLLQEMLSIFCVNAEMWPKALEAYIVLYPALFDQFGVMGLQQLIDVLSLKFGEFS